jgi:3-oxoacyl-[acyl-carrier-protein] synthase II
MTELTSNWPKVAIVGMGVIAPCGASLCDFRNGILSGKSFARRLDLDAPGLTLIGCPVPDGPWLDVLSHADRRRIDRITQLSIAAAQSAVDDAHGAIPDDAEGQRERVAVVAGIGFGGISTLSEQHRNFLEKGWRRISPFAVPAVMPSAVAANLSIRFGANGPVTTVTSACASGTQAIGEGAELIRSGRADIVIAGGAEAPLDAYPMASFARMDAMSRRSDDPESASRPFDVTRDGFVMGEGAAFVVLQDLDRAISAGRRVHAEIAGFALTADAAHVTAPDGAATQAGRCVHAALDDAAIDASSVAHVNAHGTGTQLNDRAEGTALKRALGGRSVPVTSFKGAIGHLMGGAGAVELVGAVQSMQEGLVPPTVNCDDIDPDIELDVVTNTPRQIPRGPAISCSFGFGGQNAALVVAPV